MELQQLNYFRKVAKYQSISIAANELDISEPYLSKKISLLENELGIKLFDRIGRRIFLNEYGKIFMNTVSNVFETLETGVKDLKKLSDVQFGTISIGVFAFAKIITGCTSAFLKLNPYVKFKLISGSEQKESHFTNLDFFIFANSLRNINIKSIPILKEKFVVVMSKSNPLSSKENVNLLELKDESFVFMRNGSIFLDETYDMCKKAGFDPQICCETDNDHAKFYLISSGAAISMIPEICIDDINKRYSNLAFLNIDGTNCRRTVYLGWKNEKQSAPLHVKFRNFAIEYFKHNKL